MKLNRYIFLFFWIIVLISFIPAFEAGFVFDFLGWQRAYAKGSFADIINCFGYPGNHQLLQLINYSFYKIFHLSPLPWYLLFTTIHACNGYLLYKLILQFSKYWKFQAPSLIVAGAVIVFLVHPYAVEAVVTKVCLHYLLSLGMALSILISSLHYLHSGQKKWLAIGGILYGLSLFLLEISFVTPLVVVLAGIISLGLANEKKAVLIYTLQFSVLLFAILSGYLFLNTITLGSVVGHYGEQVHLKFDLLNIAATEIKYFIKHLLYARFFSFKIKGIVFDQILSNPGVIYAFLALIFSIIILYFIKIKQLARSWHVFAFGLIASFVFTLPVANLFFTHLHIGMNDRFSYLPLAFLMIGMVGIFSMLSRKVSYSLLALMLIVNLYFQQKTLRYWHESTEVLQSLKEDFRWHDAPFVFVLNSPDNYNGIIMASIINESTGIDELLDHQTSRPFHGQMYDIFQFNMTTPEDGVHVEQTGPMQWKVTFNQWGNWWHRNSIGAGSYENEYYKAEILDYPYLVTFKQLPAGSVIIYQVGGKWMEVKDIE